MGSSGKSASLQKLHEDISSACQELTELDCESLVVTVTKNGYCQLGSVKGRKYLEEKFSFIMDFIHFCQETKPKAEKVEVDADADTKETNEDSPDVEEMVVYEDVDDVGDDELEDEGDEDIGLDDTDPDADVEFGEINDVKDDVLEKIKTNVIVVKQEDLISGMTLEEIRTRSKTADSKTGVTTRKGSKKGIKRTGSPVDRPKPVPRNPVTQKFECDQCDKQYKRFEDLVIHRRKHTGEAPFCCDTCGKTFRSRNSLRSHHLVHTGTKQYGCNICGKWFTRASGIYKHKFTHMSEAPHVCDTCGKAFVDPSNLKKHQRLHTGVKEHGCDICPMMFWDKKALEAHRRVHTGEKPFTCDICGERFRRKKNLVTHRRKHAREPPTYTLQTIIVS